MVCGARGAARGPCAFPCFLQPGLGADKPLGARRQGEEEPAQKIVEVVDLVEHREMRRGGAPRAGAAKFAIIRCQGNRPSQK